MNTNWSKILLFSLLFGAVGFVIGRMCGHGCGHKGDACGPEAHACAPGGHEACMEGGHGRGACCMDGHGDEDVHAMVMHLRSSGYQGDTVLTIDGGTVKVGLHGDKTTVEVERKDSLKVEEHH